jgi:ParB/RepB/Spo0J family partition protein
MEAWEGVREVPLEDIRPSRSNPRQDLEIDDGFVEDIRDRGVMQAVRVRPHPTEPGVLELVFGHRRLEASRLAGRPTIPATYRELDDAQVLIEQLGENAHRAAVKPLEEAEGIRQLHVLHGRTIKSIAEELHKDPRKVRLALALCELPPRAKEALRTGKLHLVVARQLARIGNEKLRAEATKVFLDYGSTRGQPVGEDEARRIIEKDFTCLLQDAPFSQQRADLVAGAGPCDTCPKKTGNQGDLFPDAAKSPNVCTDPACFRAKLDADWKERAANARARGLKVLTGKEGEGVFTSWGEVTATHARLDDRCPQDPKRRTYRKLLGKKAEEVTALIRDPNQRPVHVAPVATLKKALKAAGHDFKPKPAPKDPAAEKAKLEREIEQRAREELVVRIAAAAEAGADGEGLWRGLAIAIFGADDVAIRRGLIAESQRGKIGTGDAIRRALEPLGVAQLKGFVVEVLAADMAERSWDPTHAAALELMAQLLGVDVAAVKRDVRKALAPPTAKAKRAAGAKTRASASAVED